MADKLLLNYHDAVIYQSDLSLLECPTAWLNDACINFHMTRLQRKGDGSDVFLDPSVVSYVMHQCDEDDEDFPEEACNLQKTWGLTLHSRKRIFIPINDQFNESRAVFTRPGGGSHWSLLLWNIAYASNTSDTSLPTSTFYHFDSSSGYNATAAVAVSRKLIKVLQCCIPRETISASVNECKSPQQGNGYDCGVYLLGFAEALSLLPRLPMDQCKEKFEEILHKKVGGAEFAEQLRKRVAYDIHRLISEQHN